MEELIPIAVLVFMIFMAGRLKKLFSGVLESAAPDPRTVPQGPPKQHRVPLGTVIATARRQDPVPARAVSAEVTAPAGTRRPPASKAPPAALQVEKPKRPQPSKQTGSAPPDADKAAAHPRALGGPARFVDDLRANGSESLQKAIVLSEILAPPVALRPPKDAL